MTAHKISRETLVNTHALSRALAAAAVLLAAPAIAAQYGPLEIVGFAKDEYSFCDNCSWGLVNPASYDPRGVLDPPNPMLNQGGESGETGRNLGLAQLTLGLSHEFDNAIKIEGKTSARMRNGGPDIYDNWMTDLYAGISYPTVGSLQVGKMASRSWTRSDSFAYPMGLSSPWAESGAGYGVFPEAVRYATPEYQLSFGKIRFEATAARADKRKPLNPSSTVIDPPQPRLWEVFVQFSNEKNLIETIYQYSDGGRQSSFSKGAFYGAQGDTNGPQTAPGYHEPNENVLIIQGTYWHNDQWRVTYGVKRSEWSGQQQQCDYGPVSPVASDCFWDQPGFNYASDFKMHHAMEWDAMAGVGYKLRLWDFTFGAVRMNKAFVHQPTEWGQSNTATFLNLGVYRDLPELSIAKYFKMQVYGGLGRVMFGRQGPAPLSMPSNTAFGGADPRTSESANSVTLGVNLNF
jgi:predicted porin